MSKGQETAKRDWTQDEHGRTNSSEDFLRVVDHVAGMLQNIRLGSDVTNAARGIVASLARGPYQLAPKRKRGPR